MRRAYLTVVRGAALLPVRGAMELKSDEATNPSRYRPRAPDGRRDAPPKEGELMAKSDNRCANCGGRFGLVCHYHWGLRFCRRVCKANFLAKTAKDHARMRRWFGLLARGAA